MVPYRSSTTKLDARLVLAPPRVTRKTISSPRAGEGAAETTGSRSGCALGSRIRVVCGCQRTSWAERVECGLLGLCHGHGRAQQARAPGSAARSNGRARGGYASAPGPAGTIARGRDLPPDRRAVRRRSVRSRCARCHARAVSPARRGPRPVRYADRDRRAGRRARRPPAAAESVHGHVRRRVQELSRDRASDPARARRAGDVLRLHRLPRRWTVVLVGSPVGDRAPCTPAVRRAVLPARLASRRERAGCRAPALRPGQGHVRSRSVAVLVRRSGQPSMSSGARSSNASSREA